MKYFIRNIFKHAVARGKIISPLFIFKYLKIALERDLKKRQTTNWTNRKTRFQGKLTIRGSIETVLMD